MEVRYYRDPETGLPHIYDHGVTEAEAEWVLNHPGEDGACSGSSRQAIGQTRSQTMTLPSTVAEVRRR